MNHIERNDRRLFFKFNRSQHLLYNYLEKECRKKLGITPGQLGAIFYLMKNDGCLQKELATGLQLNKPAVTGLSVRMEKAGLITRADCSRDGRASRIHLTDDARIIAGKAFPLLAELNRFLTADFSEKEIETVHRFFDSILSNLCKEGDHEQNT